MALQNRDPDKDENISPSHNESDLTDSPEDEKVMEEEEVILDLPDVFDIPGQENIVPPKMGMFADTTIASDGEEGGDLFDEDDDNDGEV